MMPHLLLTDVRFASLLSDQAREDNKPEGALDPITYILLPLEHRFEIHIHPFHFFYDASLKIISYDLR